MLLCFPLGPYYHIRVLIFHALMQIFFFLKFCPFSHVISFFFFLLLSFSMHVPRLTVHAHIIEFLSGNALYLHVQKKITYILFFNTKITYSIFIFD